MTWARFDDDYDDNPKCRAAGKDGRALDQVGIRYCAKNLTNGVIPDHDLPLLAVKAEVSQKRTVRRLIDVGRWHGPGHSCDHDCPPCPPGHHVVHDYLDYNPSAEAELEKRRKRAEAGRKGGQRSRPPGSKPEATTEANASANAQAPPEAEARQTGSKNGTPYPVPPSDLHPPPTNVGTRPDSAGREEADAEANASPSSIVDQAVRLAAQRYAQQQVASGQGKSVRGIANWWLQENAVGARIRADSLLEHHDLTATQLGDALASVTDPPWLRSFRRRMNGSAPPPGQADESHVLRALAAARSAVEHPHQQDDAVTPNHPNPQEAP